METQQLKQKLYEKKNSIGLVGGSINIKEYDESEHDVSASISPQNWNIEISLRKDLEPIKDNRQKAYAKKKKIENGLETLLSDIFTHELAHWELPVDSGKGCPYDIYNHDKILEAVKNALPKDKQAHASYVANAFEDLMINPRCREYNKDSSGQILFWDNEGLSCKKKGLKNYTSFYEAFVKLNMHLFGDKTDNSLLKRHYSNNKKIEKAVKKTIQELSLPENIIKQGTDILFNKNNWPRMAGIFARNLAELLEQAPQERLSAFSGSEGESGEKEKIQSGNGIEQKIGKKEGKEEIAYGRYSSDEKQSSNITSYEQLDSLYRRLAKAIPINVEAMTKEHSMQISPLTFRPFDEEKDDTTKIKLSKLYVTDKGLQFAYPNQPLTITAKSKIQRRSFPDFKMVVLDNSGSMKQAPDNSSNIGKTNFIPWGDNSKYHYALLGFYGVESFLQMQGIAQYINHGLSLFSNSTRYKESNFFGIDEVRKLALAPEFSNTYLDVNVLEQALTGRESFVLSISDGDIANWEQKKENLKKLAESNYFAHIQIGSETEFSQYLKSINIPVFSVNSGSDLSKLMVSITKNVYKEFTKT